MASGIADGDRKMADRCLGANPLGRADCPLENLIDVGPNGLFFSALLERFLDLSRDLRLSDDHGVEACGDFEEMFDRLDVDLVIQMGTNGDGGEGGMRLGKKPGKEFRLRVEV